MTEAVASAKKPTAHKMSPLLAIVIFLMPYVFAWFTLRRGYTNVARGISFGWMAVLLIGMIASSGQSSGGSGATSTSTASSSSSSSSDSRSLTQFATDAMVNPGMGAITDKVARDAVDQYNIAKSGDDAIQICVQAGFVSAAYLQAKDQPNYLTWKAREKADCAAAGINK